MVSRPTLADMGSFLEFLPWQRDTASEWLERRERFAHAWLIHGMPGIGKQQFALAAAASLLCETPVKGLACSACQACQWLIAGNHPDIRRIRPEAVALEEGAEYSATNPSSTAAKKAPSREIRIDQLRELNSWFNTATHRGGWRVAVLYPADALNVISANALLKVLEEPPQHTVFLIVADAPDRLLPTLLSRCRRLPLAVPPIQDSLAWLKQNNTADADTWLAAASNAPVRAHRLATSGSKACPDWLGELLRIAILNDTNPDLGTIADELEKQPAAVWIDTLQRLFVDLLLVRTGLNARYFPSLRSVNTVAQQASLQRLSDAGKWLTEQRAVAKHPLNAKLFVHTILQRAIQACQPAVRP